MQQDKHQRYADCPFDVSVFPYRTKDVVEWYDTSTGEILSLAKNSIVADVKHHKKVYNDFYLNIPKVKGEAATKLALYFQFRLSQDALYVDVDIDFACWFIGGTKPTYHRAIRQLIELDMIANAIEVNRYWINPEMFFNGTRENNKSKHR